MPASAPPAPGDLCRAPEAKQAPARVGECAVPAACLVLTAPVSRLRQRRGPARPTHRLLLSLQAWRAHLMGPAGCAMNLRRTHVLRRAPAPTPGEHGGPSRSSSTQQRHAPLGLPAPPLCP